MSAVELAHWLKEHEASSAFVELCDDMLGTLPANINIEADSWDILMWVTKVGNSNHRNVKFDVIQHSDLKILCKAWILHARLIGNISSISSAKNRVCAFEALSHVLGSRKFKTLKTDDFYLAERWLCEKYSAPFRLAAYLQQASTWLSISFNLRLDYQNRLVNPVVHGRYGTDKGREDKLIPSEIIRDILAARHREDLIEKDKFYISVITISICTGFRIGELATLPVNCLLRLNGELHMLHFPEKGGKSVPRPIHPLLADLVDDAVNKIVTSTSEARKLAKNLRESSQLDWSLILRDREACRYFISKWAHEWTNNPNHRMINPDGAWYNKGKCFVNAIEAYTAAGYNKVQASKNLGLDRNTFYCLLESQEAARRGELPKVFNKKSRGNKRATWDTDERVISKIKFEKFCGRIINQKLRDFVNDIIHQAQSIQLDGGVFPNPEVNEALESKYQRKVVPLLKDKNGNALLYQDEALMIIHKYALSEIRATKTNDFTSLTEGQISRWLSGEKRSHGTGNQEDSVFNRLGIVDQRTGAIAKFTSHDIRHWLNTIYQNGGLTEDQIALIFNRKYKSQNSTYDQTSNKVRSARLKQAVRDNMAVGQVADSYNLLAEFSRDDAEDYLGAVLRMANPMPQRV